MPGVEKDSATNAHEIIPFLKSKQYKNTYETVPVSCDFSETARNVGKGRSSFLVFRMSKNKCPSSSSARSTQNLVEFNMTPYNNMKTSGRLRNVLAISR